MQAKVGEFSVEIIKKNIRSYNLRILATGEIKCSCPKNATNEKIVEFLKSKYKWLKSHISNRSHTKTYYDFIVDNKVKIWGEEYQLVFFTGKGYYLGEDKFCVGIANEKINKENAVKQALTQILTEKANERFIVICQNLRLNIKYFKIKNLKSRWGSYHYDKNMVTLNLQLIKRPLICLDYVITHELTHILYRRHDKNFHGYMSKVFPAWKEVKKLLNY